MRDLLIHVPTKAGGGGGKSGMPDPDCAGTSVPPILTPHTPVLQVANLTPQFDSAKAAVRRAFGAKDRDGAAAASITRAVEFHDAGGSPALAVALNSAYRAVAGGIVQGAVAIGGGGGGTSLPGPDDETPPSPISPIAHGANLVLRFEHLAFIKTRLTETLRAIEQAEVGLAPRAADVGMVTNALQGAIKDLQSGNLAR